MNKHADVLIIGGGIIGCSTAYYLAKKGVHVLVLESGDSIGDGGSSRNGGGVRQSGRDPRELPIVMYGIQNIWPHLSEELGMDVEYYQEGNLRLGRTEAHLKVLQKLTDAAVSCGLDVRMISGDEARGICSYLSDSVLGASWCSTDGHANPLLTTLAFYRKARQLGARFITGEKVTAIRKVKGAARQVVTPNGIYEADRIVVAAGLGSRPILNTVDIDVPMVPVLLETLVTEAVKPMFYQMLGTAEADFYGHQSTHGSFVFGANCGLEPYAPAGRPNSSSVAASAACRGIIRYFPILRNLKVVRTWAGWMDSCADHVPVVSTVEEVPGLIVACGFSGHGFGIAPPMGLLISELSTDTPTTLDLSALRYDRFKAK
ncbi:MAG: FAD-binding oxidoreductase [Ethanoligenens sp.]